MAYDKSYLKGMVISCAAPDDDPYAQCLGVCCQEEADGEGGGGGGVYWGEMGEGQMNGLGRAETGSATYVGFWERGMYQGPGLLLDHDDGTRQEGVFRDGALAEGSSTSASVDRQGPRGSDGRKLEGEGVMVARDAAHQRLRVLRGTFKGDHLEGRGSMWILGAPKPRDGEAAPAAPVEGGDDRSGLVLEQRFEGFFKNRGPTYGRTYFQDGRAYIGGFEGYKGRKGLGFTVTKMGKGLIANRDGNAQIGGGLIIDFNARSYRRTSQAGGEEAEVSLADSVAAAGAPGSVPEFWDEDGVYALLRAAVEDPEANYAAMDAFTRSLRTEQGVLLEEEPPRVPIPAYTRELTACPTSIYVGARDAQGRRHGEGAGVLGNGDLYKGQWRADKPEGKGALVSLTHRDVFEGEVTTATGKGAAAADDGSQVEWKAGRWSTLQGWRVEASKWLRPRVPQDFVTVHTPPEAAFDGARNRIEAFYRVRGAQTFRDDADVRLTMGPRADDEARTVFRGQVYPTPEAEDLFSLPRKRMGLLYEGQRRGSMVDAAWLEDGAEEDVVFGLERKEDGTTEYQGKQSKTHPKMCDRWFYTVYVPREADKAERTWPPRLFGPFEQGVPGAEAGDPEKMATKAAAAGGEKDGQRGGAAVAAQGGKGGAPAAAKREAPATKQKQPQPQKEQKEYHREREPEAPKWRPPAAEEHHTEMGNAWERGPPRPRGSPSLGGSETSSQAAREVPPLSMTATNPMELVQQLQQQAKQEAEEAGLDFDAMHPSSRFPVSIEAHVEGGWCAVYIKVDYWIPDPDVKPIKFKIAVMKPDAQGNLKTFKKVASPRREFPILELQNGVKYEFMPSVELQYGDAKWQVEGTVVKTSPPGPVKSQPKDLRQPFERPLNEKGEMVPSSDHGLWGFTRYVTGFELSPELPPMRSYALKVRVDNGPGHIGMEIQMARLLREAVKKVMVYIRPEGMPLPKDGEEGAFEAYSTTDDKSAPYFRAEAPGLSVDTVYSCSFRLVFPDESRYPRSDDDMPPLLSMPMPLHDSFNDEAAAQQQLEAQLREQQRREREEQEEEEALAAATAASLAQGSHEEKTRQQQQAALAAALAKFAPGAAALAVANRAAPAPAPTAAAPLPSSATTKRPAMAAAAPGASADKAQQQAALSAALARALGTTDDSSTAARAPAPAPVPSPAPAPKPTAATAAPLSEMERLLADMLKTGASASAPAPALAQPVPVPAPAPAPAPVAASDATPPLPPAQLQSILAGMLTGAGGAAAGAGGAGGAAAAAAAAGGAGGGGGGLLARLGINFSSKPAAPAAVAPEADSKLPAPAPAPAPTAAAGTAPPPELMNRTEEGVHDRIGSVFQSFSPFGNAAIPAPAPAPTKPAAAPEAPQQQQLDQLALPPPATRGPPPGLSSSLGGSGAGGGSSSSTSTPILGVLAPAPILAPAPGKPPASAAAPAAAPFDRAIGSRSPGVPSPARAVIGPGTGTTTATTGSFSLMGSDDGCASSHNSAVSTPKGGSLSGSTSSVLPDLAALSLGDIASSAEALEVATRLQRIGAEKRAAHDRKRAEQRKLRELRKQVREQELVIAGLKATLESLDEEEAGLSEELALL